MSASTCPGPTEGSWSTSPTRIRAARWRHRLEQAVHQRHVDHRDLVHDQQVAVERVLLVALEAAAGRVGLEQAVQGLGLEPGGLAHPLGGPAGRCRQGDGRRSWPRRILRMALTSVVLPTPGPPVITSTFERSASRTASRWLAARIMPVFRSTQGMRLVRVDRGPGRAASGQPEQPLGDALLGAVAARPGTRRGDPRPCRPPPRRRPAPASSAASTTSGGISSSSAASWRSSSVGRPQWPSSMASASA